MRNSLKNARELSLVGFIVGGVLLTLLLICIGACFKKLFSLPFQINKEIDRQAERLVLYLCEDTMFHLFAIFIVALLWYGIGYNVYRSFQAGTALFIPIPGGFVIYPALIMLFSVATFHFIRHSNERIGDEDCGI